MYSGRYSTALGVSALLLMSLEFSPLCTLSCARSDCSSLAVTKALDHGKGASLCHHDSNSTQHSSKPEQHSQEQSPGPGHGSGNCPAHADGSALPPSAASSISALHHDVQPMGPLSGTISVAFDESAAKSAEGQPERSPPKRAVISVYRI